jgi:hypothetical protein
MAFITALVVVQAVYLIVVYLIFLAVAYGVPKDQDHEIEVKLFPPSIRRKVKAK